MKVEKKKKIANNIYANDDDINDALAQLFWTELQRLERERKRQKIEK